MKKYIYLIVCIILSIPGAAQNWGGFAKKNTAPKTTVQKKPAAPKANTKKPAVSKVKNTVSPPQADADNSRENALSFDPASTDLFIQEGTDQQRGSLAIVTLQNSDGNEYTGDMFLVLGCDNSFNHEGFIAFQVRGQKDGNKMNIIADSYSVKKDNQGIIPGNIRKIEAGELLFTISDKGTSLSAAATGKIAECFSETDIVAKRIPKSENYVKMYDRWKNMDEVVDKTIYDLPEKKPSFPGGEYALLQYLSRAIVYPKSAEENGIQGRVWCDFIVGRDGRIRDVKVRRSVDPSLDKEAIRVIYSMPDWIPGMNGGKNVTCRYSLPVIFRLQ